MLDVVVVDVVVVVVVANLFSHRNSYFVSTYRQLRRSPRIHQAPPGSPRLERLERETWRRRSAVGESRGVGGECPVEQPTTSPDAIDSWLSVYQTTTVCWVMDWFFFFVFFFCFLTEESISSKRVVVIIVRGVSHCLYKFKSFPFFMWSVFLDAFSHLYKKVCSSVRRSVRPSVRSSVRRSQRNGPKSNKIA